MSARPTRWASCARSGGRCSPIPTMPARSMIASRRPVAAALRRRPTGEHEDPDGMAVEPFGLHDNLMLVGGVSGLRRLSRHGDRSAGRALHLARCLRALRRTRGSRRCAADAVCGWRPTALQRPRLPGPLRHPRRPPAGPAAPAVPAEPAASPASTLASPDWPRLSPRSEPARSPEHGLCGASAAPSSSRQRYRIRAWPGENAGGRPPSAGTLRSAFRPADRIPPPAAASARAVVDSASVAASVRISWARRRQ